MARERGEGRPDGLEDRVVKIRRCAAVVKGGRRFSFNALVVVGDNKGRVASGYGKANEVPPAVEKATKDAQETMKRSKRVSMRGDTIPHLGEIAAYEVAARRVRDTGIEETVRFSREPIALLSSLAEYRKPQPAAIAEYELTITSRPEQAPATPAAARGADIT